MKDVYEVGIQYSKDGGYAITATKDAPHSAVWAFGALVVALAAVERGRR